MCSHSDAKPTLAAVVLARDEEQNLRDCLGSVEWADRVCVLLDPRTTDGSAQVAAEIGAEVRERPFDNFAAQRNAALQLFEADWILFVDADERGSPELGSEVRRVISQGPAVGWWIPRCNYIWGRWVRHAGWYPDYQLRLLKRGLAHYDPAREVHEIVLLDGPDGYLVNPLIHYNYTTVRQFLQKTNSYADYEARVLVKQGICPKPHSLLLQPIREFRRRFVTLQGYRDGGHGLLLSVLMSYYTFLSYWRARRLGSLGSVRD